MWYATFMHEKVHQVAFTLDGIDSEIMYQYKVLPYAVQPEANCISDECKMINGLNMLKLLIMMTNQVTTTPL